MPNSLKVEIQVRPARAADADDIARFNLAMAQETEGKALDPAKLRAGVDAVFADSRHGFYLVAEVDGANVGCLMITYEWSDWRDGIVWWIQSVYVRPQFRGQRVYAGLNAFIRDLASSDDHIKGIRLYVDERNSRAKVVYARLGMIGEHYRVFEWMKG